MGIPIFHCHLLLVLPSKLQDLQGNQCLVAIENAGKPMSAIENACGVLTWLASKM